MVRACIHSLNAPAQQCATNQLVVSDRRNVMKELTTAEMFVIRPGSES